MKKYHDNYATCRRTYATLRVYPGDISPEEITARLRLKPSTIQVAGEIKRGSTKPKAYRISGWFLTSRNRVNSRDTRRHIDWIIKRIRQKKPQIARLQANGVRFDISCFWDSMSGHGGPTISPAQMSELARLNIEVWWDVYF